ncbi:hypothetical protein BC828DRAFT_439102 [Blastocladiella britannica]|nr:hypothetical protein BC828DRAFT_439102 [Blastocladiella britannica]
MENISLILDRILLFASHRAYSLAVGLELLQVVPRVDALDTHRHVVRRLVDLHDLGYGGHLDVVQLLDTPLSEKDVYRIASGAATAGHVHVLDWMLHKTPAAVRQFSTAQKIGQLAVTHGRANVLDWRAAALDEGTDLRTDLDAMFWTATRHCQLPSLESLKKYAIKRGVNYTFDPAADRVWGSHETTAERLVATLDWWKADYAARSMTMFPADVPFPYDVAWRAEHGLLLVDWWRNHCAETGRKFKWPAPDAHALHYLVTIDSLSMFQWWWTDAVDKLGVQEAKKSLRGILDPICAGGRTEYLDLYWDLCANSGGEIDFPLNWRPQVPFTRLNVIQWWEAKVEGGQVDPGVFDITSNSSLIKLDLIFDATSGVSREIEIPALDWWWARRDRIGLEPRLSPKMLITMVLRHDPELLQWYLDRCASSSPLPRLSLNVLIAMASRGRVDVVEQLLQLLVTYKKPLTFNVLANEVDVGQFHKRIAASAVLDYLWDIFTRIGVRFEPCYNTKSAITSMDEGELGAAKWWYAMHRVHGTVFPSAAEMNNVEHELDSEMGRWILSIQVQ